MPANRSYERLAKTICLLDSPIAGERSAALEAAGRQLEALGMCWADVAPKLENFEGVTNKINAEKRIVSTCHWRECSEKPLTGSLFCRSHAANIIRQPLSDFVVFLNNIFSSVDAETVGHVLYHAVHTGVHVGMFGRGIRHDLMRVATASRGGNGVRTTIEKLMAVSTREQGEFMMHLKRQLVVPERRSARREDPA